MMASRAQPDRSRLDRFLATDRVLELVRAAAEGEPVYLVGGAIRDALSGFPVDDIDLVVEGDPEPLIRTLDQGARFHERFGTAELRVAGRPVDLARARTETYPYPGALPVVRFGSVVEDLGRRDFTINAIAMALGDPAPAGLLDPFDGMTDLDRGILRVLHERSFLDDPTRVIRGARYAVRFGFDLAPDTAALLDAVDFTTISSERYRAELLLAAGEERPVDVFTLLGEWGVIDLDPHDRDLATRAVALLEEELWREAADRARTVVAACFEPPRTAIGELARTPGSPYEAVRLASRFGPVELVLARASGAVWLDRWRSEWRLVELEITGSDLLAAGIPQGPDIGAGIEAAFRAKLNRGVSGSAAELEVALAAARSDS